MCSVFYGGCKISLRTTSLCSCIVFWSSGIMYCMYCMSLTTVFLVVIYNSKAPFSAADDGGGKNNDDYTSGCPPNLCFFMPQMLNFLFLSPLASLVFHFKPNFNRNRGGGGKKML